MAQRRTREIFSILFFLMMIGLQLLGPLAGRYGARIGPEAKALGEQISPVQKCFPPGAAAHGGGLLARELPDGSRLYYLRVSGKTEIWSIGTDGSGEAQVKGLPSFSWPAWDLTTKGIYYYDAIPPSKEILFFDFASRRSHVAARTPGRPAPFVTSLSVSPDGKELVYAELERSSADIMLVDGFR